MNTTEPNINVLVVEPHNQPYVKVIPHTLESMQKIVGGRIEPMYTDTAVIVVNEENKINGMEFNRAFRMDGQIVDYIFGTFFICGLGEEAFDSLSESDIENYSSMFRNPEFLVNLNGSILVLRESF